MGRSGEGLAIGGALTGQAEAVRDLSNGLGRMDRGNDFHAPKTTPLPAANRHAPNTDHLDGPPRHGRRHSDGILISPRITSSEITAGVTVRLASRHRRTYTGEGSRKRGFK